MWMRSLSTQSLTVIPLAMLFQAGDQCCLGGMVAVQAIPYLKMIYIYQHSYKPCILMRG